MRHPNPLQSSALLLASHLLAPAAFAQAAPPPGEIATLAALPAEIRTVIGPDVADRGGAFAAGCVSAKGEPHSRFDGARLDGDTAQVRMEYGGIAHYFDTLDFKRVDGRWVHVPKRPASLPAQAPRQ